MSDYVEGVVKKISEKDTRNGGINYNVCVEEDGKEDWFGHGFDAPVFGEGDTIGFDIKYNGEYANVDKDTVEVIEVAKPKSSRSKRKSSSSRGSSRSSSSRTSGRGSKKASSSSRSKAPSKKADSATTMSKEDWAKKDKLIQLQSAQNTAIAFIRVAIECEAVKLPAKQGAKFDALSALVDEEASRLHTKYLEEVHGKSSQDEDDDEYDDDIPE